MNLSCSELKPVAGLILSSSYKGSFRMIAAIISLLALAVNFTCPGSGDSAEELPTSYWSVGTLSQLLVDVGWISALWAVSSLGRWAWAM